MSIISSQHLADETIHLEMGKASGNHIARAHGSIMQPDVTDSQYPQGWVSGGWDEVKIVFSPSTYFVTKKRRIRDMG